MQRYELFADFIQSPFYHTNNIGYHQHTVGLATGLCPPGSPRTELMTGEAREGL